MNALFGFALGALVGYLARAPKPPVWHATLPTGLKEVPLGIWVERRRVPAPWDRRAVS